MISFIPNLLTSLNLLCGVVGIVLTFNQGLTEAFYLILLAAVFDFFDGFAARMLKVNSDLGKELDSLADMITFGVLPGMMLFQYISISQGNYFIPIYARTNVDLAISFIGFLIPIFSALRLAKFNIDTNQTHHFLGLPTPANAILIGSLGFIMEIQFNINYYVPLANEQLSAVTRLNYWDRFEFYTVLGFFETNFHLVLAVVLSSLLVSRIPLFSLKLKSLKFKENKLVFSYLIFLLAIILLNFLPYFVPIKRWIPIWVSLDFLLIPLAIVFYIIFSLIGFRSFNHEVQS